MPLRKPPISLKLINPTPTIIFVSQSETVSMFVLGSKSALSVAVGLTLGTPNKNPMNAPAAIHIIAHRFAVAWFLMGLAKIARNPAQFEAKNKTATSNVARSVVIGLGLASASSTI